MALVLYLEGRRMPSSVRNCFTSAESGKSKIIIPAIVLAEIGYLAEKSRISATLEDVNKLIDEKENSSVVNLDLEVIRQAFQIKDIPELHDRLIAATAAIHGIPLLSNDPAIEKSVSTKTIWK